MKTACEDFARSPALPALRPFVREPVEPALVAVASAFVDLQAARQTADYDVTQIISPIAANDFVATAREAIAAWRALPSGPNTTAFLARLAGLIGHR
jgi:hypothetical protein